MTAPSDRGPRRMFNLQTALGLLVTAGIVWVGLTRFDLSETVAALGRARNVTARPEFPTGPHET